MRLRPAIAALAWLLTIYLLLVWLLTSTPARP